MSSTSSVAPGTLPRLLLLTDRSQLRLGRGLVRTVHECVEAGLTHLVVREHDLPPDARHALVAALADLPGLTVISSHIADPVAHGLHQPSDPTRHVLPTATAHQLLGRSCHTRTEVYRAAADGVDYVTLSPFALTPSKPGHGPALGPDAYADHRVPVYALGGITPRNARAARDAGAHGVAVMGAVMRAAEPGAVVAALLEEAA
ncbi:thiamine-phosphate pyrophosphorylase [Nocardioides daedukensis]|uniref:Thiamine-phosphate pyrophosphorylase n=1 Tax=Nocardioides daedukensis TaxID=634462 RepID=A0A7Y9S4E3_9ACTN|nr:thiamine phosphate synthase [Nocardioides daedukensis]NYG60347.1 thiamine-phosphate pyrophosphorylase [Nocardioides daedukensis]